MVNVAGVRFKKAGKIYYFDPQETELAVGDRVIVETARGQELGEVVVPVKSTSEEDIVQPLKPVLRKATEEDLMILEENKQLQKQAFEVGVEKIGKHQLPMKLVDVEYTFDRSKVVFYFTSDGRVDFRDLVKDLAAIFRTRIELRQIGVRDEAKMLGGLGICGRTLCCATFLGDFEPVSIKMAKDQSLSLNPTKISGVCGRLMCCLRYESEVYKDAKDSLPSPGDTVHTEGGKGTVLGVNPITETLTVSMPDDEIIKVANNDLVDAETDVETDDRRDKGAAQPGQGKKQGKRGKGRRPQRGPKPDRQDNNRKDAPPEGNKHDADRNDRNDHQKKHGGHRPKGQDGKQSSAEGRGKQTAPEAKGKQPGAEAKGKQFGPEGNSKQSGHEGNSKQSGHEGKGNSTGPRKSGNKKGRYRKPQRDKGPTGSE